jgi:hypothetical protein
MSARYVCLGVLLLAGCGADEARPQAAQLQYPALNESPPPPAPPLPPTADDAAE